MKKVNAWVFDLDDTLFSNVHDYADSILDACRLIIKSLGDAAPHVSGIVALEQEIDLRRVQEINPKTGRSYGYSMKRFPTSLVAVYHEICKRARKTPVRSVESELIYIGMKAFEPSRYARNIYPDTRPVLDFLQSRGDLILMLTKGDKEVQGRKLSVLDAGKRFFKVRVVESNKTPEIFAEMKEGLHCHRFFSVGNDYNKDISPALEVGYHGIWIPVETWEVIGQMDNIRAMVDKNRCTELRHLRELAERYDEIVGEAA